MDRDKFPVGGSNGNVGIKAARIINEQAVDLIGEGMRNNDQVSGRKDGRTY